MKWPLPEVWLVASLGLKAPEKQDLPNHGILQYVHGHQLLVLGDAENVTLAARILARRSRTLVVTSGEVLLREVPDALRWIALAHRLVSAGKLAIPQDGVLDCAGHWSELMQHSEPQLRSRACSEVLAPLFRERKSQQLAIAETVTVASQHSFNAAKIAQTLGVHEQTVRSRLRRYQELFAPELTDPNRTLALLNALAFFHRSMSGREAPTEPPRT